MSPATDRHPTITGHKHALLSFADGINQMALIEYNFHLFGNLWLESPNPRPDDAEMVSLQRL